MHIELYKIIDAKGSEFHITRIPNSDNNVVKIYELVDENGNEVEFKGVISDLENFCDAHGLQLYDSEIVLDDDTIDWNRVV